MKHAQMLYYSHCGGVGGADAWKHDGDEEETSSPESTQNYGDKRAEPPKVRGSVIYEGAAVSDGGSRSAGNVVVVTSSLGAISRPCRTAEESGTRG